MRRLLLLSLLLAAPGCVTLRPTDVLFAGLQDYYTAGGVTSEEKRHHYEQEQQRWQEYRQTQAP